MPVVVTVTATTFASGWLTAQVSENVGYHYLKVPNNVTCQTLQ